MLGCSNSDDWGADTRFNTKDEAITYGVRLLRGYNANCDKPKDWHWDFLMDDMGIYPQDNAPIFEFEVGQLEAVRFPDRTDCLLELISQDVYDEFGDYAEDYLDDVDQKHQSELQELIIDWAERHNYLPNYFTVSRTETIDIRNVEGEE
ncbi:hypothetical protein B0U03_02290 [Listeria monocytogenes]|nr:hypothetical protein [Listeria monocytogenes]EAE9692171.1 hypothetical protein [Listeria monocytogenes]EAE9694121.1 hypothetical protein [Listeria monocytogenes]EAE9697670.1 hypothetical protein [Listeria monocytogenes]EAE9709656.1 hypothetical protein [Listeria monocytogenes]